MVVIAQLARWRKGQPLRHGWKGQEHHSKMQIWSESVSWEELVFKFEEAPTVSDKDKRASKAETFQLGKRWCSSRNDVNSKTHTEKNKCSKNIRSVTAPLCWPAADHLATCDISNFTVFLTFCLFQPTHSSGPHTLLSVKILRTVCNTFRAPAPQYTRPLNCTEQEHFPFHFCSPNNHVTSLPMSKWHNSEKPQAMSALSSSQPSSAHTWEGE